MQSIKTQIVFPKDLLEELDQVIQKRERSDFVVKSVQERLERLKLKEEFAKAAGIWKDHPEMQTDAQVRRYLKQLRGADTGRTRSIKKAWNG